MYNSILIDVQDARSLIQRERERDVFYLMKLWRTKFIQHDGSRVYVWVWSFKEMALTGVQRSTRRRKKQSKRYFTTTNPPLNGRASKQWPQGDRPVTNPLRSHSPDDRDSSLLSWDAKYTVLKVPNARRILLPLFSYNLKKEVRNSSITMLPIYMNIQDIIFCRPGNLEPNHVADWLYKIKILITWSDKDTPDRDLR